MRSAQTSICADAALAAAKAAVKSAARAGRPAAFAAVVDVSGDLVALWRRRQPSPHRSKSRATRPIPPPCSRRARTCSRTPSGTIRFYCRGLRCVPGRGPVRRRRSHSVRGCGDRRHRGFRRFRGRRPRRRSRRSRRAWALSQAISRILREPKNIDNIISIDISCAGFGDA